MPLPSQVVDRSTPFTFTESELGWSCPCGSVEDLPAMDKALEVVDQPIVTNVQWNGSLRIVYIFCTICSNRGWQSTLHQMVDVAGPPMPAAKGAAR